MKGPIAIILILFSITVNAQQFRLVPPQYLDARDVKAIRAHCQRIARIALKHQSKKEAIKTYRICLIGNGWRWRKKPAIFH